MTPHDFRRLALGFPEAVESSHMSHPDFRVRKKIFATLWPDDGWGMVKLTPEQQKAYIKADPKVFTPVKGGWGRMGATQVQLKSARKTSVRNALATAWLNVAPKQLAEQMAPDERPRPKKSR